jgi:hypothetical protein
MCYWMITPIIIVGLIVFILVVLYKTEDIGKFNL